MIIFPPASLVELRRDLFARMKSGEMSEVEAFRQALTADPDDFTALVFLGLAAEKAGDPAEAERLARAAIRSHPSSHEAYLLLQRILSEENDESPLANGYLVLALKKIGYDEDAIDDLDFRTLAPGLPAAVLRGGEYNYELLRILIDHLEQKQPPEPKAVTEELEPHRLIHQLREAGLDPLPEEVTDAILNHAEACAPMLLGNLREFGEDQTLEDDHPMILRALALLGEIGDPAVLPEITEFLDLDDESLEVIARWAFQRIAFRKPAASLQVIREMIPKVGAVERIGMALQLGQMPETPGRLEVLQSLARNLQPYSQEEQEAVVIALISSGWLVQGGSSPWASELQQQYGHLLSPDSRKELKKLRAEHASLPPYVATPDELTVYDICGQDLDPQPVVKQPKPGRNDPCWCGSGKKYKKCHLDQDEGR